MKHVYSRALTVSGETRFSRAAHLLHFPKTLTAAPAPARHVSLPVGESAATTLSDALRKPRRLLPQKLTIAFVVNLRRTADACIDRAKPADRSVHRLGWWQRELAHSSPIFRLRINAVLPFTRDEQRPWNGLATRDASAFQRFHRPCLPDLLTHAAIGMRHQPSPPILKTLTLLGNRRAPDAVFHAFAQMMGNSASCNHSPFAPRGPSGHVPDRRVSSPERPHLSPTT